MVSIRRPGLFAFIIVPSPASYASGTASRLSDQRKIYSILIKRGQIFEIVTFDCTDFTLYSGVVLTSIIFGSLDRPRSPTSPSIQAWFFLGPIRTSRWNGRRILRWKCWLVPPPADDANQALVVPANQTDCTQNISRAIKKPPCASFLLYNPNGNSHTHHGSNSYNPPHLLQRSS